MVLLRRTVFFLAMLLVLPGVARAQVVVNPISYDMLNGEQGSFTYHDDTYPSPNASINGAPLSGGLGQLTDGVVGANDWSANLGNGNAYEWVGWNNIQPTITFDFGSVQNFFDASFHTNNFDPPDVGMWGTATFTFSNDNITYGNTIVRNTTAAEQADHTARFIATSIPVSARFVRVHFDDGNGSWIFLSEAQFRANATPGTPEPGVISLLAGFGVTGLAFFRRRRRC